MSWSPWVGGTAENKGDAFTSSKKPFLIHPTTTTAAGSGVTSTLSHDGTIVLGRECLPKSLFLVSAAFPNPTTEPDDE